MTESTFSYSFFGLHLSSQLELPGLSLSPHSEENDVVISWGQVHRPEDDITDAHYKPDSVSHQNFYFLEVDDIAKYYIDDGTSITIERADGVSDRDIAAFLADTVLTALLLMRDKYVFHGSAIKKQTEATLICGRAGEGKSAIALHLVSKGYEFIEDDRCLPSRSTQSKEILIQNGLPYMDVWKTEGSLVETMTKVEQIGPVRENIAKLRVDMTHHIDRQSAYLRHVVILRTENLPGAIEIKKLTGIKKFQIAKSCAHKDHLIPYLGNPSVQFRYIVDMLSSAPIYLLTKKRDSKAEEVADFIINHVLEGAPESIKEFIPDDTDN